MPHVGEDLGVDLHNLYVAGTRFLPGIAEQIGQARSVLSTSDHFDAAFHRSPSIGGTWTGPAQVALAGWREVMEKVLRDSEDNMHTAGQALVLTANEYHQSDTAAHDKFNSMLDDGSMGQY